MPARTAGFSALEFTLVLTVVSLVIYAILPSVEGTLQAAHETVVRQTAQAMQESLKLVALKHRTQANPQPVFDLVGVGDGTLDLNRAGFPIGTTRHAGEQRTMQVRDCAALWYAMLGGVPPSAAVVGNADFRVQTRFDSRHGLGCFYRYLRAGEMSIQYYPDDGSVISDARF